MRLYTKQILEQLGYEPAKAKPEELAHADKVEDRMSENGLDFSECTNAEFKRECRQAHRELIGTRERGEDTTAYAHSVFKSLGIDMRIFKQE